MKISKKRYHILTIVISYFIISCLYIIFSDKILLYLFENDSTNALLFQMQSYKGIVFVLLTAVIFFFVLKKREALIVSYLNELDKSQQQTKKSLKKIALNEYLLRKASFMANIGAYEVNTKNNSTYFSNENYSFFDIPKGQLSLQSIRKVLKEESNILLTESINKCMEKGVSFDIELESVFAEKPNAWIRAIVEPIYDKRKKIIGRRGVFQDITRQKLQQKKLDDQNKKLFNLNNALNQGEKLSLVGSWSFNPLTKKNQWSLQMFSIWGFDSSKPAPEYKSIVDRIHLDDLEFFNSSVKNAIGQGKPYDIEFRICLPDGAQKTIRSICKPFLGNEGKVINLSGINQDVTQSVLANEELQKNQKTLQNLTSEISLVEERQKKKIATNIHDHLSQSLVISRMRINELKKKPQLKVFDEDLQFIETHISEALSNSRKITYELSPPVLYELGLIEALHWFLEDVEVTHNIECRLKSNISSIKLEEGMSILLYRSVQEALTNIIKHANASLVTLDFNYKDSEIAITITDNGVGFNSSMLDGNDHSGSGFGLFTIKERIRNFQAEFTVVSKINAGTTVRIFIPLSI